MSFRAPPPKRVIIVGAGAIGASIGALLFEVDVNVVLVARGTHGAALLRTGVDLRTPRGGHRVRVPVEANLRALRPDLADLVIVATMGHDTGAALAPLDPEVTIASFQNGLSPVQTIADRGHPTIGAMVYVPAERRAPGVIALSGIPVPGTVLLGRFDTHEDASDATAAPSPDLGRVQEWTVWLRDELRRAGFRAESSSPIAPWLRAKLLSNLGGIVAALCDTPAEVVVEAARDEARAVWRASSQSFYDLPALLARVGPLESAAVDGRARVGGSTRAALARADHLETACLHGSIIDAGRLAGVPTPVNEALVRLATSAKRDRMIPGSMDVEVLCAEVGL